MGIGFGEAKVDDSACDEALAREERPAIRLAQPLLHEELEVVCEQQQQQQDGRDTRLRGLQAELERMRELEAMLQREKERGVVLMRSTTAACDENAV